MLARSALLFALLPALANATSARAGCVTAVADASPTFSKVTRAAGIRFLVGRVNVSQFPHLAQNLLQQATTVLPKRDSATPPELRFHFRLAPLLDGHVGRWANYANHGSDAIGEGVRSTRTFDWDLGFLFSPELLDELPFEFEDYNNGRRGRFRSTDGSVDEYAALLEEKVRHAVEEDGFHDASARFGFHFPGGVPTNALRLVWAPAPLRRWLAEHPGQIYRIPLGTMSYQLADPYPPVQYRVANRVGDDWEPVTPGAPHADEDFDPETLVGTWWSVVPNWAEVERQLPPPINRGGPRPRNVQDK